MKLIFQHMLQSVYLQEGKLISKWDYVQGFALVKGSIKALNILCVVMVCFILYFSRTKAARNIFMLLMQNEACNQLKEHQTG